MGAEELHADNETITTSLIPTPSSRQVAILLAGHASEYIQKIHGGVASLFKLMLSDPGETWHTFHVVDGEFPSDDDLLKYDAFVVTGSRYDAHGSEPWVLQLCEVINKAYLLRRQLLGICFGHQVICRALGGKTGRGVQGWQLGLKKIEFTDAMYSKPYALKLPSSLSIIKLHQDEVYELPPGGKVLASSANICIEMFGMGNQVLGIQGHPEFQEDMALDLLDNYLDKWCTNISVEKSDEARLSLNQGKVDREILHQICKSFLQTNEYRPMLHMEQEHDFLKYFMLQESTFYDSFDYDMVLRA